MSPVASSSFRFGLEPASLRQRARHQLSQQLMTEGGRVEAVGKTVALPPVRTTGCASWRSLGRQRLCGARCEGVGGQTRLVHAGRWAGGIGHVLIGILRWIGGLVLERCVEVHHGQALVAAEAGGQLRVEGLHPGIKQRVELLSGGRTLRGGHFFQHHLELRLNLQH